MADEQKPWWARPLADFIPGVRAREETLAKTSEIPGSKGQLHTYNFTPGLSFDPVKSADIARGAYVLPSLFEGGASTSPGGQVVPLPEMQSGPSKPASGSGRLPTVKYGSPPSEQGQGLPEWLSSLGPITFKQLRELLPAIRPTQTERAQSPYTSFTPTDELKAETIAAAQRQLAGAKESGDAKKEAAASQALANLITQFTTNNLQNTMIGQIMQMQRLGMTPPQ